MKNIMSQLIVNHLTSQVFWCIYKEYCIPFNIKSPLFTTFNFQDNTYNNMCNYRYYYKVPSHFSNDDLDKNSCLKPGKSSNQSV